MSSLTEREQDMLVQILLALIEEASDLKDDSDGRPDRADLKIAAAFEGLARNLEDRVRKRI